MDKTYWEEVRERIGKNAQAAADEFKKDLKQVIEKSKKTIDKAADDIRVHATDIKGKVKESRKELKDKAVVELDRAMDTAKKNIDSAVTLIKKNSTVMLDKARENAEALAGKAKKTADEGAQYVKLRSQLFMKERDYQHALADLGSAFMKAQAAKTDIATDKNIKTLSGKVKKLDAQCRTIQKKMKELLK